MFEYMIYVDVFMYVKRIGGCEICQSVEREGRKKVNMDELERK